MTDDELDKQQANLDGRTSEDDSPQLRVGDIAGSFVRGNANASGDVVLGDKTVHQLVDNASVTRIALAHDDPELVKIGTVYVETDPYLSILPKLKQHRLLVLYGAPHAGKYATALKLAVDVSQLRQLPIATLYFTDMTRLLDSYFDTRAVHESDGTIIVARDAFRSPGMELDEIERYSGRLRAVLEQQNSYLILTADMDSNTLVDVPDQFKQAWHVPITPPLAGDMLGRHLRFYGVDMAVTIAVSSLAADVARACTQPYLVAKLARLINESDVQNDDQIGGLIAGMSRTSGQLQAWFDSLHPNERYFAILVALFDRLDSQQVSEIYEKAIDTLAARIELRSALEYDVDSLLLAIRAVNYPQRDIIEFQDEDAQEFVLDKARRSYIRQSRLLVQETLTHLVNQYSDKKTRDIVIRTAVATAVGELGKASKKDYLYGDELLQWATSDVASVRAACGYAFRRSIEEKRQQGIVLALIDEWLRHQNWRVRWSAVSALQRLTMLPNSQLRRRLSLAARDAEQDVRRSVGFSTLLVGQVEPEKMVELIATWSKASDKNADTRKHLRQTAFYALRRILGARNSLRAEIINDATLLKLTMTAVYRVAWFDKEFTEMIVDQLLEIHAAENELEHLRIDETYVVADDLLRLWWYLSRNPKKNRSARTIRDILDRKAAASKFEQLSSDDAIQAIKIKYADLGELDDMDADAPSDIMQITMLDDENDNDDGIVIFPVDEADDDVMGDINILI